LANDATADWFELVLSVFAALAQFERRLICERTKAGLAMARTRGRQGGRPKTDPNSSKVRIAAEMHRNTGVPISEICESLGISRAMLYRFLKLVKNTPSSTQSVG